MNGMPTGIQPGRQSDSPTTRWDGRRRARALSRVRHPKFYPRADSLFDSKQKAFVDLSVCFSWVLGQKPLPVLYSLLLFSRHHRVMMKDISTDALWLPSAAPRRHNVVAHRHFLLQSTHHANHQRNNTQADDIKFSNQERWLVFFFQKKRESSRVKGSAATNETSTKTWLEKHTPTHELYLEQVDLYLRLLRKKERRVKLTKVMSGRLIYPSADTSSLRPVARLHTHA